MTTLTRTGSTYDLSIGEDGILRTSSGIDAYAEIVEANILTLLGEIQLDPRIGIDYMGTVFKTVAKTHIWKYYVVKAIEALPFVKEITSFSASFNSSTKVMNYRLSVLTDHGMVSVAS